MADEERWIRKGPEVPLPPPSRLFGEVLLERVRRHGAKPVMIDGLTGEAVSGAQLLARSVSVALELQQRGVRPGDVVSAALDNCFEVAYVFLGALYAGAVYAPFNPDLHADDVRTLLEVTRPRVVLCAPRAAASFRALLRAGGGDVVEVRRGAAHWEAFLAHSGAEVAAFQAHSSDDYDSPVCIMPSSGTTGPPKGVAIPQKAWHYFATFSEMFNRTPPEVRAKDVSLHVTCNFWMSGFMTNIFAALSGNPLVIYVKYNVDDVLAGIEKYKITNVVLSPPHVAAIAKHPDVEKYDVSSVREFLYGGAPLSLELRALAEKRLGVKMLQCYAQTECLMAILPAPGLPEGSSSVGVVAPNAFAKIVDPNTGKTVGPNTEGEICIKCQIMFSGYYGNPKATRNTIDKDGWVHSGDVGYFDEEGYFYVCDRYKELIKYRGNQIIPADLESVLTAHEGVKDAAVVGVEHDDDQERAVAFVALQEGHDVSKQELLQLLRDKLPEYKYPHGGLHFIKEIPRTAAGKIQRRELRQEARLRK